jgi:hypothetical protein
MMDGSYTCIIFCDDVMAYVAVIGFYNVISRRLSKRVSRMLRREQL